MYWLSFKVKEGEGTRVIRLAANLQEVQDLLAKVKDALKQAQQE